MDDQGVLRHAGERAIEGAAVEPELPPCRQVVDSRQDEPGCRLGPAVAQSADPRLLVDGEAAVESRVELVVPGDAPDAQRCPEERSAGASESPGPASMSTRSPVTTTRSGARAFTSSTLLSEPLLAEERPDVEIRELDDLQLGTPARERGDLHLVPHHARTARGLGESDDGKDPPPRRAPQSAPGPLPSARAFRSPSRRPPPEAKRTRGRGLPPRRLREAPRPAPGPPGADLARTRPSG